MKTITKHVAYDDTEFTERWECERYEALCREADAIIGRLTPTPKDDGCNFQNGSGFIQHDSIEFMRARDDLLRLALKQIDHEWIHQSIGDCSKHPSWAGRIIDECCTKRLNRAWYRIMCTDGQFREWGQPYYALHPEQARGGQINQEE